MRSIVLGTLGVMATVTMFASVYAQDPPTVTIQGFCITKTEMRCEEVALPGATIPYDRLPKLADGKRVIYFYSDQRAGENTVLLHVLEAEDFDAGVKVVIPKALQSQAEGLTPALKAIAAKFTRGGLVEVTAFQAAHTTAKPMRVFSQILVDGPGAFSGQVLDQNGAPVAGSERVSFLVARGPTGGQRNTAPGSGLKSIDADG